MSPTGLVRETETVRPRRRRDEEDNRGERRLSRDDDERRTGRRDDGAEGNARVRRRRSSVRGRPELRDELSDLNRGGAFVAAETMAVSLDIFSRVFRNVIDRAFDEDYAEPGDVVRGLTNEADEAAYDLIDELRRVPRRLERRFDEAIRSPRKDRGERAAREND